MLYVIYDIESQFLGRLVRSPGVPKEEEEEEKGRGLEFSRERKGQTFFSTLLCLGQYNSVSCSRTCFSLKRIF